MNEMQQTESTETIPPQTPETASDLTPILFSKREAVQLFAADLFHAVFDNGGFEEMISSTGFGIAAGALKPVLKRNAAQSIDAIDDEKAEWIINQVHKLSARFEDLTGVDSPYHYGE